MHGCVRKRTRTIRAVTWMHRVKETGNSRETKNNQTCGCCSSWEWTLSSRHTFQCPPAPSGTRRRSGPSRGPPGILFNVLQRLQVRGVAVVRHGVRGGEAPGRYGSVSLSLTHGTAGKCVLKLSLSVVTEESVLLKSPMSLGSPVISGGTYSAMRNPFVLVIKLVREEVVELQAPQQQRGAAGDVFSRPQK